MSAPTRYDTRAAAGHSVCPRCRKPVWISRCRTQAREMCGSCGHTWTPGTRELDGLGVRS